MKRNYSEALPKTLCNSTISLDGRRSKAFRVAKDIGLTEMLSSDSLRDFASKVSGVPLASGPGMQLIRYLEGDYVGPHNDHHPEYPNLRNGYVDLQITLCTKHVARQFLVYEQNGLLNAVHNVGITSGISISMLPFWHQVTPLEVKPGRGDDAKRWLLLASFEIAKQQQRRGG